MAAERAGLFVTKSHERLIAETRERGASLRRAVGVLDLTALGLGGIIGTGIFVIIGEAIGKSGPSIVIAFVLAGVTCAFSALSYAELASTIPVSGSAYTYAYATMGELLAWIIGWDLILEYAVAVAAVAVGWGGYFNELLNTVTGLKLPTEIAAPPGEGGVVNIPAVVIVLAIMGVLIAGIKQSVRSNSTMVFVKIVILLLFIGLGVTAFSSSNLTPFFSGQGFAGTAAAAALIFFAYIGFDAVSTSSEEVKRPARDLPIAIIGSLAIATVLYIAVSVVAAAALPYQQLDGQEAPLAIVLERGAGLGWGAILISIGALIAITSVVLTIYYGQTRVFFAMARDGLVPRRLARVSERTKTPILITVIFGVLIAALAALVPLTKIAELVNIGTLFAFLIVNIGVIVLRRTRPDLDRGFRVPLVPVVPLIGAALCIYLMTQLPGDTWLRFLGWMVLGLLIYAVYGWRNSTLRRGRQPDTAEPKPV